MFRTYRHVSQRIVGHFCSSWKPTTPGLEERRAESTSSRPACVLAHVTLNRAPTCVEIPQSMEVLKHGQMRFLRFPPARCVPQVRPRPLASASIPQNLPVSPPLFKRDKAAHFLLSSLRLPPSIYISAHGCRHPGSAHLTVPSQMRLAGSLCRRELKQQGAGRQTDRQRRRLPRGCLTLCPPLTQSLL